MQYHLILKNYTRATVVLPLVLGLMFVSHVSAGWKEGFAASQAGNHEKAFEELLPLAEQGHGSAQSLIGVMYYNGEGVEQDFNAAMVWLTLAANQGYSLAQYNLGVMYDNGQGTDQDFSLAFKWYGHAAQQGHAVAQFNLGSMYGNGDGVDQDLNRAYMWLHISGMHGNRQAVEQRKELEKSMTAEQIADARKMTGTCMGSRFEDC